MAIRFGDKWAHIFVFLLLALLWLLATWQNDWLSKGRMAQVSFLALLYGIVIEVLQGGFFETRSADIWDIVADAIGILLGVVVFLVMKRRISLKT